MERRKGSIESFLKRAPDDEMGVGVENRWGENEKSNVGEGKKGGGVRNGGKGRNGMVNRRSRERGREE